MYQKLLYQLFIIAFTPAAAFAQADTNCTYCGKWTPTQKVPDQPHLAGELLSISGDSIALPGCSAVKFVRVYSAKKAQENAKGNSKKKLNLGNFQGGQMQAILRTKEIAACNPPPLPDIPTETFIEISLRKRTPGGEELTVSLFTFSGYKQLLYSYWYVSGEKPGTIKRISSRPKSNIFWRLIRKGYNACDEGSGMGAIICTNANFYETDGKLNAEWRRLKNSLNKKQWTELVSRQRDWLKSIKSHCKYKNEGDWNHRWVYSFETQCRTDLYMERISQFKKVFECISNDGNNCLDIPNKP